ncbi:MAG TPA: antibiotic biosynthesis monooxygenase [Kofleriaceae bacterium]|nr:antibiotic biosynthesis monooxygenase [Kofleriaceae bacterium]
MSVKVGLVVRIVAKSGKEAEVAKFLAGALPLAQGEDFTPAWFALRASQSVFYIVDAFADESGRDRHLGGAIAAALFDQAPNLLAESPTVEKVEVLASKLPG